MSNYIHLMEIYQSLDAGEPSIVYFSHIIIYLSSPSVCRMYELSSLSVTRCDQPSGHSIATLSLTFLDYDTRWFHSFHENLNLLSYATI